MLQGSQDTLLRLLTKYNDIQNSDWGKKDVVIIVLVHRGTLLRFCSDKKVGFVLQNVYLQEDMITKTLNLIMILFYLLFGLGAQCYEGKVVLLRYFTV